MIEKIWTVHESGLLLRLGQSELTRIEYQSRARSLPPEGLFPFPENTNENAFVVVSGRMLAMYFSDSRARPIIVELTPGDFFGATRGVDAATICDKLELVERSTIVAIPRDLLQDTLNAHRRIHNRAFVLAGWTPQHYSQPLADNFFVPTQKRLARFLFDEVTRRSNGDTTVLCGLSDLALSQLMNSDTQLIQACLEDWERADIICRRGNHIEVVDLGSLAEAVRLELREPIHTNGNTIRIVR